MLFSRSLWGYQSMMSQTVSAFTAATYYEVSLQFMKTSMFWKRFWQGAFGANLGVLQKSLNFHFALSKGNMANPNDNWSYSACNSSWLYLSFAFFVQSTRYSIFLHNGYPMSFLFRKPTLIFVSSVLLALAMWSFGHKQLGGFDMGALVDTGWRMANSQIPYVDFPLTTPVAFYIGAGWAIQLFGAKWSSFVIIAIIFTIVTFLVQIYLLDMIMDWKPALAISLASQLLCSVVVSYWWYNSITMNAVCLFLAASYLYACKPNHKVSAVALSGTLTLLSLMKPHIA